MVQIPSPQEQLVKPNKKTALIVQDRADFCLLLTKNRSSAPARHLRGVG